MILKHGLVRFIVKMKISSTQVAMTVTSAYGTSEHSTLRAKLFHQSYRKDSIWVLHQFNLIFMIRTIF